MEFIEKNGRADTTAPFSRHTVTFKNQENHWDNALPLGNNCFGSMLYYEDQKLYMPMNHYEVYYNVGTNVLPKDIYAALQKQEQTEGTSFAPGEPHRTYRKRADANQPKGKEPFTLYRTDSAVALNEEPYYLEGCSGSHPMTGDLVYHFAQKKAADEQASDSLQLCKQELTLLVEDAAVELTLLGDSHSGEAAFPFTLRTITAREDCILQKVSQNATLSGSVFLKSITLSMAPYRDIDPPQVRFEQIDRHTVAYTVSRLFVGAKKPFVYTGIIKLLGAACHLTAEEYKAEIVLDTDFSECHILTGIFTEWRYRDPLADGSKQMDAWAAELDRLYAQHADYWRSFFAKSRLQLPDLFLEHVYYVNQYALDCCSGKDGIMKHHACGLNGLWDIRHPTLWGSMWYWDVNIEASFAGVFSGNRLDLAKVFSDGLLSYTKLAEQYARTVHDMPGYAIDYPYQAYYCVWPWCAQYLWYLYEYSLDEEYLRKDAYPLFLKLCEFVIALFVYNEETDTYDVYPDIAPEQGPFAHNTTITVASVKYLLQFTLKSAEILGDTSPILSDCRRILEKLPPYAVSGESRFGRHLKDSADAPDNLWIRHPSMLMPLFPIGEYDMAYTDQETLDILSNTVDFLAETAEIGIFGGSWIAAAAARLGRGQTALRLLYERGIDHMLRSNGLTAEATERFMNFCLITRQPLYYPCMMEFTGEMLAAVNEMLLQSHNGLIRVFPAIPDGDKEWERMTRNGYSMTEYIDRYAVYEAWTDVRFDTLLAKGAFEVSAKLKDRKLQWIKIHSLKGGTVHLTSPFLIPQTPVYDAQGESVAYSYDEKGIVRFETTANETYRIGMPCEEEVVCQNDQREVLMRTTYLKRRIFIGEDCLTSYHKALDGFMRDWHLGNQRLSNHTVYKFDFGDVRDKVYTATIPRQALTAEGMAERGMAFLQIGSAELGFTVKRGFGFADADSTDMTLKAKLSTGDSGISDCLRRDFVEGTEPVVFIIEAPRGQYELLAVSGDENQAHITLLETENGFRAGGEIIPAGDYQCELIPIIQKRDTPIRLRIATRSGYTWKLNLLLMNAVKGY